MGRFAESLAAGCRPLWVDATAYAGRLLAGGHPPWRDVPAAVAWHRDTQALIKSDVVALLVAPVAQAWYDSDRELSASMRAKRRVTGPIKALLAHDSLRRHLVELVEALRGSYREQPLALALPSPRRWVAEAYRIAFDERPELGEDEIDTDAMYLADFLRIFAESRLDIVLFEESADDEPHGPEEVEWYRSAINLAAHYGWDVGNYLPAAAHYRGGGSALAFLIAPRVFPGPPVGLVVPKQWWQYGPLPECPAQGFRFTEVPIDAEPETVLERLAAWRQVAAPCKTT